MMRERLHAQHGEQPPQEGAIDALSGRERLRARIKMRMIGELGLRQLAKGIPPRRGLCRGSADARLRSVRLIRAVAVKGL
eukprot:10759127-Alexandrium_andersonii.AAC.1